MNRLAIALGCLVPPLVFYRLHFGIDFTDESYYLAVALRFIRGGVPFVDELFVNQSAILIALPFYRAIHAAFGTEGLVLHARYLYFAFTVVIAAAAYVSLETRVGKTRARLAAIVAVACIPLNIPALSYNTLGGGFFAIGLFLAHGARSRTRWAGAGVALALASFAYPTLVIADVVALAIAIPRAANRRDAAIWLGVGHAAVVLAFFPYFARAGESLGDCLTYSVTAFDHGGGWHKWVAVFRALFVVNLPRAAAGLALLLVARVSQKPIVLVAFFPVLLVGFSSWGFPGTWAVTYFALGALAYARTDRALFVEVIFPSLAAGLLTAWTSMSSVANAVIGMWAAVIATSALFAQTAGGVAVQLSLLVGLVVALFCGQVFYVDADFAKLTARVESGPFRGLHTTPDKRTYLTAVTRDITTLENPTGYVVFYEFPAGYLLTKMRPGTPESWMRTVSRRKDYYVRYYRTHLMPQNLVFAFHILDLGYLSPVTYDMKDPFVTFVRETHAPIVRRRAYDVFAPR